MPDVTNGTVQVTLEGQDQHLVCPSAPPPPVTPMMRRDIRQQHAQGSKPVCPPLYTHTLYTHPIHPKVRTRKVRNSTSRRLRFGGPSAAPGALYVTLLLHYTILHDDSPLVRGRARPRAGSRCVSGSGDERAGLAGRPHVVCGRESYEASIALRVSRPGLSSGWWVCLPRRPRDAGCIALERGDHDQHCYSLVSVSPYLSSAPSALQHLGSAAAARMSYSVTRSYKF